MLSSQNRYYPPDSFQKERFQGTIIAVRGSVIDIRFSHHLPELYTLLRTENTLGENGASNSVAIEVLSHLSEQVVRGIALTPVQGLARGTPVTDTRHPLQVPVGEHLLGRVFNVFGEPVDGKAAVKGPVKPLHASPVPLSQRATQTDILETGIKAIDLLAPIERGGKGVRVATDTVGEVETRCPCQN